MFFLELTFINYNSYALQHGTKAFFTQEVNEKINVYTVPSSRIFLLPEDMSNLLAVIRHHESENIYALDVLDDLHELIFKLQREGLTRYSNKKTFSDLHINIHVNDILYTSVNKKRHFYRVLQVTPDKLMLIGIRNCQNTPIPSEVLNSAFILSVINGKPTLNGKRLLKYSRNAPPCNNS